MKEIKAYLTNQKDIYTMLWLEELKSKEINLKTIQHYLNKIVVLSEELEQLNKNNGER